MQNFIEGSMGFIQEKTLPSGRTVMVARVTSRHVQAALLTAGEDEYLNLRAGRKDGAALIEALDLVVRLAVGQQLDESEAEFDLSDKLEIFGLAYQGNAERTSFRMLMLEALRACR